MRRNKVEGEKVYSLANADNIILLAEEEKRMRNMIKRFKKYVRENNLSLNMEKSKILRFTKERGREKATE